MAFGAYYPVVDFGGSVLGIDRVSYAVGLGIQSVDDSIRMSIQRDKGPTRVAGVESRISLNQACQVGVVDGDALVQRRDGSLGHGQAASKGETNSGNTLTDLGIAGAQWEVGTGQRRITP